MTAGNRTATPRRLMIMAAHRIRRPHLLLAALALSGLAACSAGGAAEPAATTAMGAGPTSTTAPTTSVATPEAVVAADRALAVRLYHQLAAATPGEELFFSPYSIAVALSMVEAGARGQTAAQLQALLGSSGSGDSWHDARAALDEVVTSPAPAPEGFEPLRLAVANGAFGQAGFPFATDYLDRLSRSYGAGLQSEDFSADADAARRAINAWVGERTEGHIEDLLPEGSVTDLTRLVLANAVFFTGNWRTSFDPAATAPGPFTTDGGERVEVPVMHGSIRTSYGKGDGWSAVRLPYVGGYSMVVVVPDAPRLGDIEARLAQVLDEARAVADDHQVTLSMPRFAMATTADLVPVLAGLGAADVFQAGTADLTGMATGPDAERLYVSGAFHQATVEVDEEGTTATAATGLVVSLTSLPTPATLDIDRPFLVAVEHDATGELLFLGRVLDPRP